MNGTIYAVYFSPTHTSQKLAEAVADALAQRTGKARETVDLTRPENRGKQHGFGADDVLLFGFPVYGGRIPRLLEDELLKFKGDGTAAIALAVYGNRDYDDALLEAQTLLKGRGFCVVAAGAFIGEHSYSRRLAADRPDGEDMQLAAQFAEKVADKLAAGDMGEVAVKGRAPYKERMPAMPFLPETKKDACTHCMVCVERCPMGVTSQEDPAQVSPGCIQCMACVKACPVEAKYFDAEPLANATIMLEARFMARREPEYFI